MRSRLMTLGICAIFFSPAFSQKSPEPFKQGDRVVFAGNSITEAGFYETYIWLYYITHFPERKIEVINGGIGGDVARQIYVRLDDDILAKKPTVLSVSFGMNDSRYFEYPMHKDKTDSVRKSAIDTSYKWFTRIRDKLNGIKDLKKIMMLSSPYDETVKNGKEPFWGKFKTMEGICAFQKEEAAKNNWAFVDLFYPMTEINKKGQQKDTAFTITGPDRIHPGNAGHLVMAYLFLKAQGLANKPIADIVIDANAAKTLKAENASISGLQKKNNNIAFTYLAKSLPFPIDSTARVFWNPQKQYEALDVIPFTKEFNSELLQVQHLDQSANYNLKIDGQLIGSYTGAALNGGVNLAMISTTPQYHQAKQIMDLQLKRKDLEDKLRSFYWVSYDFLYDRGLFLKDTPAITDSVIAEAKKNPFIGGKKDAYLELHEKSARDKVQKQMDEMTDKMYQLAKPVAHKVSIEKVN
ncbi:SGNH/GDSL hydrolase family protein [Danxiaibacter flavus]|uniref:SGNH/GDSL hydrolase family protein n=1 Tax=Danxiaibacter flavus TaxID=3049108 RepID=A0ABV3ZLH2_9BACT|nr:SGNH/GDSL hydrolase family protein [Chitinophagaceae bacterium DXS]